MAEPLPKVAAPPDALDSIVKLFSAFGPMMGSGKTSGTTTQTAKGSVDPAASKQMDELLASIMGQNQNPALDDMIGNIMERAKQSFAPAIGASISGGNRALSDTVLKQLANEMAARATGEAAGAKLNFIQGNNQTAASLVNNKVNATRSETRTGTTSQATAASPMGKMLQYGTGALGAYSLYRKLTGKKGLNTIDDFKEFFGFSGGNELAGSGFFGTPTFGAPAPDSLAGMSFNSSPMSSDFNFLGFNNAAPEASMFSDFSDASGMGDFSNFAELGSVFDIGSSGISAGADAFIADAGGIGDFGGSFLDASGEIAGVAGDAFGAAGDVAGGAGDVAGGVGDFFGGVPVVGPVTRLIQGDVGGAAGSAVGGAIGSAILPGIGTAVGSFLGGTIGGGSVVCTELLRQGKMSPELYQEDIVYARKYLSPITMRGYRFWGVPLVRVMQKSPFITNCAAWFANNRAKSLSGKNWKGHIIRSIFTPVCYLIGLFVKDKGHPSLYVRGVA